MKAFTVQENADLQSVFSDYDGFEEDIAHYLTKHTDAVESDKITFDVSFRHT